MASVNLPVNFGELGPVWRCRSPVSTWSLVPLKMTMAGGTSVPVVGPNYPIEELRHLVPYRTQ